MNTPEQKAVAKLGWSADSWNRGDVTPFGTLWEKLPPAHQQAAELLGFDYTHFGSIDGETLDHGFTEPLLEDPIPEEGVSKE